MLIEVLLQPLHEFQVILRPSLNESAHIDILQIRNMKVEYLLNSVLKEGRLKNLVILGIFICILSHKIYTL